MSAGAKAKTKTVGQKELVVTDFAVVGDPNNPETWHYPMNDEAATRHSIGQLLKAQMDAADREAVAKKLLAAAKKFGIGDDEPIIQGLKDLVKKQLKAAESNIGRSEAVKRELYRYEGSRAYQVMTGEEKIQVAMDLMLGVKAARGLGVKPLFSIREAYALCTGDTEVKCEMGSFWKISEATTLTTDFPNLLLNSMTKRLMQDYAELGQQGLDLLYSPVDIADFKSQDRVRLGYLPDLANVAEDAPYVDFAKMTDEKVNYSAATRGNTLPVTRETILSNDIGAIVTFAARIARASHRTLKQFITNFYVNNTNYGVDSIAWFHGGHNNLGTAALSVDELIARELAIFSQQEKDSGKALGLTLDWLMVPGPLKATARKINQGTTYSPAAGVSEPNPFWHNFGDHNERIVVNELLSDTNDWYCGTMATNAPFLEVGFVQGVREPQIIIQDSDGTAGAGFTNDRVTFKARHEYGGGIVDFRGVSKNVVP